MEIAEMKDAAAQTTVEEPVTDEVLGPNELKDFNLAETKSSMTKAQLHYLRLTTRADEIMEEKEERMQREREKQRELEGRNKEGKRNDK